jgi:hypothetical protein
MSTDTQRFHSPEAAALSEFSAARCRVVAGAAGGDDAYVVLDANASGAGYLYGVNVHRCDGGWEPGSSGNGPGWTLTDPERDLGTLAVWGEAPDEADRVRVEWNGETREAPVAEGVYLLAWWRVPSPDTFPREVAFRVHGEWVDARS